MEEFGFERRGSRIVERLSHAIPLRTTQSSLTAAQDPWISDMSLPVLAQTVSPGWWYWTTSRGLLSGVVDR